MPPRSQQPSEPPEQEDPTFTALSTRLQRRIDRAFDTALNSSPGPPRKRRKVDSQANAGSSTTPSVPGGFIVDNPSPGGFIVDDPPPGGFLVEDDAALGGFVVEDDALPGGFVVDSDEHDDAITDGPIWNAHTNKDMIPMSLIPHALQLLDLQPDDEDVLGVFRHAASGWDDKSRLSLRSDPPEEQYVSRKDWRAVCAALLDTGVGDEDDDPQSAPDDHGALTPLESSDSGDDYQGSEPEGESSEAGDGGSDEEYQEGGLVAPKSKGKKRAKSTPTRSRRRTRRSLSSPSSENDDANAQNRPLTARQRLECRRAFALFFPSIPDAQLDKQRIMIKDITRVAALLKEKITADETIEMLEMFSTSADKSMSLSDFERMMMAAKLA